MGSHGTRPYPAARPWRWPGRDSGQRNRQATASVVSARTGGHRSKSIEPSAPVPAARVEGAAS